MQGPIVRAFAQKTKGEKEGPHIRGVYEGTEASLSLKVLKTWHSSNLNLCATYPNVFLNSTKLETRKIISRLRRTSTFLLLLLLPQHFFGSSLVVSCSIATKQLMVELIHIVCIRQGTGRSLLQKQQQETLPLNAYQWMRHLKQSKFSRRYKIRSRQIVKSYDFSRVWTYLW